MNFKILIIFVLLSSSVTATALVNASMTPALMRDMSTLYLVHQKDGQARFLEGFDWSRKSFRYTYCQFADKHMELKGIIILLENLNCLLRPNCFPVQLSCFRYIVSWRFDHPICLFSLHPTTRVFLYVQKTDLWTRNPEVEAGPLFCFWLHGLVPIAWLVVSKILWTSFFAADFERWQQQVENQIYTLIQGGH